MCAKMPYFSGNIQKCHTLYTCHTLVKLHIKLNEMRGKTVNNHIPGVQLKGKVLKLCSFIFSIQFSNIDTKTEDLLHLE